MSTSKMRIVGLFTVFVASDAAAFLWSLATAALSLCVGTLLVRQPVEGAVSLTLVLISFLIAVGIFQIAAAIRFDRTSHALMWPTADVRLSRSKDARRERHNSINRPSE